MLSSSFIDKANRLRRPQSKSRAQVMSDDDEPSNFDSSSPSDDDQVAESSNVAKKPSAYHSRYNSYSISSVAEIKANILYVLNNCLCSWAKEEQDFHDNPLLQLKSSAHKEDFADSPWLVRFCFVSLLFILNRFLHTSVPHLQRFGCSQEVRCLRNRFQICVCRDSLQQACSSGLP